MFFLDPDVRELPVAEIVRRFFTNDPDVDITVVKHNTWYFNFLIARTWRKAACSSRATRATSGRRSAG